VSEQRGIRASSDTIKSREPTWCPGQVGRVGPLVRGALALCSGQWFGPQWAPMDPLGQRAAPFGVCARASQALAAEEPSEQREPR
jgi:hypothetical protein